MDIETIIKYRKTIAATEGSIGLYWISKNLSDVLTAELITIQKFIENKSEISEWLSIQKTPEQAFKDFNSGEIIKRGGNTQNYRSLPRGFVAFNVTENLFYIVGGDWLTEEIGNSISEIFKISKQIIKLAKNNDYNMNDNFAINF